MTELVALRYRERIIAALNLLGTGNCPQPNCEGCILESDEAREALYQALGLDFDVRDREGSYARYMAIRDAEWQELTNQLKAP